MKSLGPSKLVFRGNPLRPPKPPSAQCTYPCKNWILEFCFLGLNWPLTSNLKTATPMGWFWDTFISTNFELNVASQTQFFGGLFSKNEVFGLLPKTGRFREVPLLIIINFHMVPDMGQKPFELVAFGQKLIGLYNFSTIAKMSFNWQNWYIGSNFWIVLLHISIEEISADILRYRNGFYDYHTQNYCNFSESF